MRGQWSNAYGNQQLSTPSPLTSLGVGTVLLLERGCVVFDRMTKAIDILVPPPLYPPHPLPRSRPSLLTRAQGLRDRTRRFH